MGQLGMMAATLGVHNRANQVVRLFDGVSSIEPVVLPAFAHALERGHQPAAIFLKKVEFLSALTWPTFAISAILAEPLCSLILGAG